MTKTPTVRHLCLDLTSHVDCSINAFQMADGAANPNLAALTNMAYDDDESPEGMAREAKDKGNSAFQRGAGFYGHAIKHYNDAIDHIGRSTSRE